MTTPHIERDKPDDVHIVITNDLIRYLFNSEEAARDTDATHPAPPTR